MANTPRKLIKIFDEYTPILTGKGNFGRYAQKFKVVKKEDARSITIDDLRSYVESLNQKYPDRGFTLRKVSLGTRTFYVITKKSYVKTGHKKIKIVKDRIPIYADLKNQEFYVPASYLKNQRKLANYVIMRVLGALGISTVKYIGMGIQE